MLVRSIESKTDFSTWKVDWDPCQSLWGRCSSTLPLSDLITPFAASFFGMWFFYFFFCYQLTPVSLVWNGRRDANRFGFLPFFLSLQIFDRWAHYGTKEPVKGILWIRWSMGQSAVARGVATSSHSCRWKHLEGNDIMRLKV